MNAFSLDVADFEYGKKKSRKWGEGGGGGREKREEKDGKNPIDRRVNPLEGGPVSRESKLISRS